MPRLFALAAAIVWPAAVAGLVSTVPQTGSPAGLAGYAAACVLMAGALWLTAAWDQPNLAVLGLPLWTHGDLIGKLTDPSGPGWTPAVLIAAGVTIAAAVAVGAAAWFTAGPKLIAASLIILIVGGCFFGAGFGIDDDEELEATPHHFAIDAHLPDFTASAWIALAVAITALTAGALLHRTPQARQQLTAAHRDRDDPPPLTRATVAATTTAAAGTAGIIAALTAASGGETTVSAAAIWWVGLIAAAGLMAVRTPLAAPAGTAAAAGPTELVGMTWLCVGGFAVLAAWGPSAAVLATVAGVVGVVAVAVWWVRRGR
ncbi:hypothetical protein AB0I28_35960 [Phytomonospora sp. NPDC050363]|uniref:hypothetical protein n=1 Tax=Phytomonospora sp. NPDC050363 TaxID=3155642 RepID=UPI0033D84AC3